MELAKRAAIHTFYQMTAKVITLSLGLYTTALLTRALTVEEFSRYVVLMTLMLQIVSIVEWGSGYVTVREATIKQTQQNTIFSSVLVSRFIGIIIALILLFLLSSHNIFSYSPQVLLTLLFPIAAVTIKNLLTSIFHVKENFLATSSIEVVSSIILTVTIFLFRDTGITNSFVFISLSIATGISILIIALFNIKQIKFKFHPDFKVAKQILVYSFPVGAQLLVFNIYNRIDTYMLQLFHGENSVAYYGLSYKIYENTLMLAAFTMTSLYPVLARSKHTTRSITTKILIVLISISLLGSFSLIILSDLIIQLINPEYLQAAAFIRILALAIPFAYINHVTGFTLTAINKQKAFLYFAIIALIVNLTANWTFIPLFGATAAAYVTVVTELSISLTSLVYLYRVTKTSN